MKSRFATPKEYWASVHKKQKGLWKWQDEMAAKAAKLKEKGEL